MTIQAPDIQAFVNKHNLMHHFRRGPGGSTVYACLCGAQERYTSADSVCPVAQEAATRSVLIWLGLPFIEDVQGCKGGRVARFLVNLDGKEDCFLPLQREDHSLLIWGRLSSEAKDSIRGQLAVWSGPPVTRDFEARRLVLSRAGYEAAARPSAQIIKP